MSLYNHKKLDHLEKAKGKYVGASTKANNYEYGRKKAKSISVGKAKHRALEKMKSD